MATLKTKILILVTLLANAVFANEQEGVNNRSIDAPDPASLKAYKRYWDAFKEYEEQRQKSAVVEYERAKHAINAAYEQKEADFNEKRIERLNIGVERYTENLQLHRDASNRPFVMLNLAQMLSELSSLQEKADESSAKLSRQKALTVLRELDTSYPDFEYKDEALYLRAILLEASKQNDAALVIWRKMANSAQDNRYSLHANLAAGDDEFDTGKPNEALKFYENAYKKLKSIDHEDRYFDELRVYYRIGWAAYKATLHAKAIDAAEKILAPGVNSRAARQRDQIINDAVDLMGLSLVELDEWTTTRNILKKSILNPYGGAIIKVMLERYQASNQYERIAQLSTYGIDMFGASKELPSLLIFGFNANQNLKRTAAAIQLQEKLAMLLPESSLWRKKHEGDAALIAKMETQAAKAAEGVASWYYEQGLTSNTPKMFHLASGFYSILVEMYPAKTEALGWRLKIANCHLYGGQLEKSLATFDELISELKVSPEILILAMYQRTMAIERLWKQQFESALQKGHDPTVDKQALSTLALLEKSVEAHANKYPNQSRSIDLLLVAASANRDHNRFVEASRYWQRCLLAGSTDAQRALAIRGIVFAQLRSSTPASVIAATTKFLSLENKVTLSQNLQAELLGVLSSATTEEGNRLAKIGQQDEAGQLMVKIASEYKAVPKRNQIFRDGAYMLAISGNWQSAEMSAKSYLEENQSEFWGDMTYLLARSAEYQLRFAPAVKSYIDLARREPKHARALVSVQRAEKLAVADENFASASEAAAIQAEMTSDRSEKLELLASAVLYQSRQGNHSKAMILAQKRKSQSVSDHEKLDSEILLARVRYAQGDQQTSVDDMDSIEKQIEKNKFKLGDRYPKLSATANEFLADDLRQKFQDFRLSEQSNFNTAVKSKSDLFAELTRRLDKVASLDQAEASPKARYHLAIAANDFADELAGLPVRSGEPLTLRSQTRFSQNIGRLKDIAKRYHANNILAKQKAPNFYKSNEWIKKSALALGPSEKSDAGQIEADQTTLATHMEVPQQWNF